MWFWIVGLLIYVISLFSVLALCNAAKRGESDLPKAVPKPELHGSLSQPGTAATTSTPDPSETYASRT